MSSEGFVLTEELRAEALRLAQLAAVGTDEAEIQLGQALTALRPNVNGEWKPLCRAIFPGLERPEDRAKRLMEAAYNHFQTGIAGERGMGILPMTDHGRDGRATLDDNALALAPKLRRILDIKTKKGRKAAIVKVAEETGRSSSTVYAWMRRLQAGGEAALMRKGRCDKGRRRQYPDELAQEFLARRIDPLHKHEKALVAARQVMMLPQFSKLEMPSNGFFYQIEDTIDPRLKQSEKDFIKTYEPWQGGIEKPHVNYSWAMDATRANVLVWDRDPKHAPYRPWLTTAIDECSGAVMFALYHKKDTSREIIASVLYNAIRWKSPDWPQSGMPKILHHDNGAAQKSDWMASVEHWAQTSLGERMEIIYCEGHKPWQKGVVENWHSVMQMQYEQVLGRAYIGNNINNKPDHHPGSFEKMPLRDRNELPTLQSLNEGLKVYVTTEFHKARHSRLKMSRNDFWVLNAKGHMAAPSDEWLQQLLMMKQERTVTGACIKANNFIYRNLQQLGPYEGCKVMCWYDMADIRRVKCTTLDGKEICWADIEDKAHRDSPLSMEKVVEHRQAVRREYKALQGAKEIIAEKGTVMDAQEALEQARRRAAVDGDPIPFVQKPKLLERQQPETMSADEMLQIASASLNEIEENHGQDAHATPEPIEFPRGTAVTTLRSSDASTLRSTSPAVMEVNNTEILEIGGIAIPV